MKANAERKRAYDAAYFAEHRVQISIKSAVYYLANKERMNLQARNWHANNSEKVSVYNRARRDDLRGRRREHYQQNKSRYKAQAVARKDHVKIATPCWTDLDAIAAIYAEAERLTTETGIDHHVDHFYPLRGKTMCGLHVEGNLRIIPKLDNLRKGNSEPEGVAAI